MKHTEPQTLTHRRQYCAKLTATHPASPPMCTDVATLGLQNSLSSCNKPEGQRWKMQARLWPDSCACSCAPRLRTPDASPLLAQYDMGGPVPALNTVVRTLLITVWCAHLYCMTVSATWVPCSSWSSSSPQTTGGNCPSSCASSRYAPHSGSFVSAACTRNNASCTHPAHSAHSTKVQHDTWC